MTDQPKVVAEFELTPEDWEEMNAYHLFDSEIQREALRKVRILGVLIFVLAALLNLLSGWVTGGVIFGAMSLVFPIMLGPMQQRANKQTLKKMTREGIANGMFGRHRIEIRDEGLFHATDTYESLFRWHGIDRVKERDGNVLIYIGPNAFLPVPSTAFSDSARLRAFASAFYEGLESTGRVEGEQTAARLPEPSVSEG